MSGGLVALLDDIATLAKVTASSIDDVAANAVKASSKAVGVVIDDTAVTPQYVSGLSPARELPIIGKIARGSLINKLFIILPIALLLTWLAPQVLPFLLVVGGAYLCFEGGEKVLGGALGPEHADDEDQPKDEDAVVRRAVTTDMVLSTEIMLLALAQVQGESSLRRVVVLVLIALLITFAVYGLVGALIKLDDAGIHLARRSRIPAGRWAGRAIVRAAPVVFKILGVLGTVAMLWVGGHLVIANLAEVGVPVFHHILEVAEHAVASAGGFVTWLVETLLSGIFGVILGAVIAWIVVGASALVRRARTKA